VNSKLTGGGVSLGINPEAHFVTSRIMLDFRSGIYEEMMCSENFARNYSESYLIVPFATRAPR
jgi:hypothetical protein